MDTFRCIQFDNGSRVFLRPRDHDRQIDRLLGKILKKELVINDMSVERAAAWNYAVYLYNMPVCGSA